MKHRVLLNINPSMDDQRKYTTPISCFLGDNFTNKDYDIESFHGFIPVGILFKHSKDRNLFLLSWGHIYKEVAYAG